MDYQRYLSFLLHLTRPFQWTRTSKRNNLKMLVVEDDDSIYLIICRFLSKIIPDIQIDWEKSVPKALDKLRSNQYEFLIVDIHLEGAKSGLDLFELSKRINPELPVIIMTSTRRNVVANLVNFDTKNASFLNKPITSEKLRQAISACSKKC